MTKEQIIEVLHELDGRLYETQQVALNMAIKALEQPTSDDCVNRSAVMVLIEDTNLKHLSFTRGISQKAFEDLLNGAQDLPPATPTQRWIPCSERLPEDRNIVLVTAYWHETYQVMMASYFGDGLWWCVPFNNCGDHMQKLNPKAWQPLPKAYEEK